MSPDPNEPLESLLSDVASAPELDRAWAGVRDKRAALAQGRERLRITLAVAAATCVVVLGGWAARGREPTASAPAISTARAGVERSDGAAFDHLGSEETIVLSDRSRIVTSEASELDILQNGADVLSLHLVRGHARFEVTPGGPRDWIVEAAGVSVEVVGTVFEVERSEGSLRVRVERGVVVVRGANVHDGVRRLTAGDELVVDIRASTLASAASRGPAPEASEPIARAPRERRIPAEAGSTQLRRPGLPGTPAEIPATLPPRDAATLLGEADALRREGRDDDAIAALITLVTSHPTTPEAGIAAFTIARLMHARGRDAEARHWYERALELDLPAALAEDARAALADDAPAP